MVQVGYLPSLPTQPIVTKIGMGCPVAEMISREKFQIDRFRGFRAPDCRKSLSPIDLRHHPYTVINVKNLFDLLLSIRVMTDDLH